jgi:hypothetical protein
LNIEVNSFRLIEQCIGAMLLSIQRGWSTHKGDTTMFGFDHLARRAREWRSERKRRALQSVISHLPAELQKDIGWPAPVDPRSTERIARDIHARPIL